MITTSPTCPACRVHIRITAPVAVVLIRLSGVTEYEWRIAAEQGVGVSVDCPACDTKLATIPA